MVLDASLHNTQYYKVWVKDKVEQYKEKSRTLLLHLGVVAIEKGTLGSPSTMLTNFTFTFIYIYVFIIDKVMIKQDKIFWYLS